MIRRWGFIYFFLLTLLLSAGARVGSYWRWVGGWHNSARTGGQEAVVVCGSVYLIAGDKWPTQTWRYWVARVDPRDVAAAKEQYRSAPYCFLGFAVYPDTKTLGYPFNRMLIIPLWFPTGLAALGLVWSWRRKRHLDRTRQRGFPVHPTEPIV